MCFIYQEREITAVLQKKTPQKDARVKGIIIITYDAVRPERQLEGKLKRADPVQLCDMFNRRAREGIFEEYFVQGDIDTVKVPPSKITFFRIAGRIRIEADFILVGEG